MENEDLYINGKLNDRRHQDDHDYLKKEKDRRQRREKFWNNVFSSFITGALLMIFTSIMGAIGWAINTFIHQGHIK